MREMKLSDAQLAYLRDQPLGGAKNKVGAALGLLQRTQLDLATAAGLTPADMSDIRNGKYQRISLDTAQRISGVFGVCTDDLFPRLVAVAAQSRKRRTVTKRTGSQKKAAA